MQRGIVIEKQAEHLVILTADGLFKKIPRQDDQADIGDEVTFTVKEELQQRNWKWNWKTYVSGAVAAVLAFFFLFPLFINEKAHAHTHVYIEMEPGVEMRLNDELEVVQIRPLNSRAKALIQKLAWNEEPVKKVVVDYLKQAKTSGYLKRKDKIVLSAINEKGSSTSTLKSIETVIEQDPNVGKKAMDIEILSFAMPKEIKAKAEQTGLTPGKYGVWLLSKKEGKEIPVSQLVKAPISALTEDLEQLKNPPTESEWKEIAAEEEKQPKLPNDLTNPIQTKPNTAQPKNQQKNTLQNPSDLRKDPATRDGNKDQHGPTQPDENKTDENPIKFRDTGGEDGSTAGSTGDANSKTNHATP